MISARHFLRCCLGAVAALVVLALATPADAKMPGYSIEVTTEGPAATFTLVVDGVDGSVPADQRCCGPRLDDLLEVFPAALVGPDLRPLPGALGRPVPLREVSAGVYQGTVELGEGEWVVLPFPATDMSTINYDFNETYPAVSFEIGAFSAARLLVPLATLVIAVSAILTPTLLSWR